MTDINNLPNKNATLASIMNKLPNKSKSKERKSISRSTTKKYISLDAILDKTENTADNFDLDKTLELYRNKHNVLKYYDLIHPHNIRSELELGDIIRYSIDIDSKLSCAGVVVKIKYSLNKKLIEKIVLKSLVHQDSYWRIFPSYYFIFKYIPTSSLIREALQRGTTLLDVLNKSKNTLDFRKLIEVDPSIKNKIFSDENDKAIDKILEEYETKKRKTKK